MTPKTVVKLVSDLSDRSAVESITFGLEGATSSSSFEADAGRCDASPSTGRAAASPTRQCRIRRLISVCSTSERMMTSPKNSCV